MASQRLLAVSAPIFALFLLVSTATITTPAAIAYSSSESVPQVEVIEPNADLGEVFMGQALVHTFIVKNLGDAVLKLAYKEPVALKYARNRREYLSFNPNPGTAAYSRNSEPMLVKAAYAGGPVLPEDASVLGAAPFT